MHTPWTDYLSLGKGVLAQHLAPHLGGSIRWIRSDTDLTRESGRNALINQTRSRDVVLVGLRPDDGHDPVSFYATTGLCASHLASVGCPVVLFGSSAVYGHNLWAQEEDGGKPVHAYGIGKWVEEQLYRICRRLLILRVFDTYGDRRGVISDFQTHLRLHTSPRVSPIHMDFLHQEDVALLMALVIHAWLAQGAQGQEVVNIGSGHGVYLPALWEAVSGKPVWGALPSTRPSCIASVLKMLTYVPYEVFRPLPTRLERHLFAEGGRIRHTGGLRAL